MQLSPEVWSVLLLLLLLMRNVAEEFDVIINGYSMGTVTMAGESFTIGTAIQVGNDFSGANGMVGAIDNFRIWEYVLLFDLRLVI